MKKKIDFTAACLMLTLGAFVALSASSCADDEILLSERHGCTDPESENYDRAASSDDGSCVYARDKFPGTYSVSSLESQADYDGYISLVRSILVAPDFSQAGRVRIKFVDNLNLEFGIGEIDGNALRAVNIRSNPDEEFIELKATQIDGLLTGQFVITAADQSKEYVCSFIASKD